MNRSTEALTQRTVEAGQSSSLQVEKQQKQRQILVPWDKQKSYTLAALVVSFIVWACIFFPLL